MFKVVVVDDRVTNRNILTRLAMSVEEGIAVKPFPDFRAALDWMACNMSDLVIVGDRMPERQGADFIRALRTMPGAGDIPVLALIVYHERSYGHHALEAGASDILLSPVDPFEFRVRVRNLLTLRKQQKLLERHAQQVDDQAIRGSETAELTPGGDRPLRCLLDRAPILISASDRQGRLTFVNELHRRYYDVDPAKILGEDLAALYGEDGATRHRVINAKIVETGESRPGFEQEIRLPNGSEVALLCVKSPRLDQAGQVAEVITAAFDITDLKRAQSRLRLQAGQDQLTGLPNRDVFRDLLDQTLTRARRRGARVALLLLDLDRFKGINDAFGLPCGDLLLKGVAERMQAGLRESDSIGRLGGDEFVILQTDVRSPDDPRALARRLNESFSQPFIIKGDEHHISASIGITLFPNDGHSADRLIKNAELAMYRAKAVGRNGICFYSPQMNLVARRTGLMERELRQAFVADQFTVHYQPRRSLSDDRILGMEALLRWHHPRRGMVRPTEFIGLAEDIGLITPITERVLERACRQHRSWSQAGLPPLQLSVNLSPVQFREKGVVDLIKRTLERTGIAAEHLEVELTESVMLENSKVTIDSLTELREIGVTFSLDDFGTGYSSLAYVRRLPVQRLKIDQSFVRRLGLDRQDDAIVRAIIDLGHSLDLKITAEGVETLVQLNRLAELGCDEAQGDLISPPLPPDAFAELFAEPVAADVAAG